MRDLVGIFLPNPTGRLEVGRDVRRKARPGRSTTIRSPGSISTRRTNRLYEVEQRLRYLIGMPAVTINLETNDLADRCKSRLDGTVLSVSTSFAAPREVRVKSSMSNDVMDSSPPD